MAEITVSYGTGAIQSPPDHRDFQIADHFASSGVDFEATVAALPTHYTVTGIAHLNQHNTPMCVAYSSSALKSWEDAKQGVGGNLDEPRFFRLIGGGPNGAITRNALEYMRKIGYPELGGVNAAKHKIKAYFAIPKDINAIKATIHAFGPIECSTPWYNSWFHPASNGVLPHADYQVGGHAIVASGWDDTRGIEFHNSWGSAWGRGGECWMPYPTALHSVWEWWKVQDA